MSDEKLDLSDTVLFTIATNGYVPFVENLEASLERVGLGGRMVVYSLDEEAHEDLVLAGIPATRVDGTGGGEWSDYGTREFTRTVAFKYSIAHDILRTGKPVLFIDGDIVFLRDPLPALAQVISESGADLVCQLEVPKNVLNAGFWWARPSEGIEALLQRVEAGLDDPDFACDQVLLNQAVDAQPDLGVAKLDPELFACGNQFLSGISKRSGAFVDRSRSPFPRDAAYLLHFNYLVGKREKIRAMQRHGVVFDEALDALGRELETGPRALLRWIRRSR